MAFRLETITFADNTSMNPGNLCVIVGANNAGKSQALRDILSHLTTTNASSTRVVTSIAIRPPADFDEALSYGILSELVEVNGNFRLSALAPNLSTGHHSLFANKAQLQFSMGRIFGSTLSHPENLREFAQYLGSFLVSYLPTDTRLRLVNGGPSQTPGQPVASVLQGLFNNSPTAEQILSDLCWSVFGVRLRIDYSGLTKLLLRVGDRSIDDVPNDIFEARKRFPQFETLDDQGDGLRSFAAVGAALVALRRPITIIDEPEAFLHPPQCVALGRAIAESASDTHQIIVATHSVDILRGIVTSSGRADVVRVARSGGGAKVAIIPADRVRQIANDPLLASSRVLDGLFYRGVVVTEADADEAFYSRVCTKLGVAADIHFTHAHNKQTIPRAMSPYSTLRVPCVGIVDIDVLRDEADLRNLLRSKKEADEGDVARILALREEALVLLDLHTSRARVTIMRDDLKAKLLTIDGSFDLESPDDLLKKYKKIGERLARESDSWRDLKSRGLDAAGPAKEKLTELIAACDVFGIFIVPCGELESWLIDVGVGYKSAKNEWIVAALQLIPNLDVTSGAAIWSFVSAICSYIDRG